MSFLHHLFSCALLSTTSYLFAQTDSLKLDSLLQLQIENEIGTEEPVISPRTAASANPNISLIGDMQGLYRSYGSHNFDAVLNEVEFSFESVIDPYARADFFYSVGEDVTTGEFSGEIEEAYVTTLSLPAHLQLKAGRFKAALGRMNRVHSHALPFIDVPDANATFFGEEGLKGDGLSLSWLVPNKSFYQELTIEATNPAEGPVFQRSQKNGFLYLAHLKNFWDLSDNATLEFGLTGVNGENIAGYKTNLLAIDLTYKWKPVQFNTYKSITFQNEFYFSHANLDSTKVNSLGFYSLLSAQVAKRLFLTGRYDYSNAPYSDATLQQSGSLTVGWYATEFQKIEAEIKHTVVNESLEDYNYEKNFSQVLLRWIFIIGSHGAHAY